MENFLKRYFKGDYVIWVIYILLVMFSISVFYSASASLTVDMPQERTFIKHIIFLLAGFVVLIAVYLLPRNYIKFAAWAMLAFAFVMQIAAYSSLGSPDNRRIFFFQPSEFTKFALIVITAHFIDRFQNPDFLQKNFKLFFAIVWLPLLFIIPSNASMGIIIILPLVLMMTIGSIHWRKIIYFFGIPLTFFIIISCISYPLYNKRTANNQRSEWVQKLADNKIMERTFGTLRVHTWKGRIGTWSDDKKSDKVERTLEESRIDEQALHSQCAIYDGREPKLPGNSFWRNHIPQGWSDYIFSIIVEEYGIYGAIFVILLFLWLLWRAGVLLKKCETVYSAIVIVGVATVIVFQALVHIGVCTRLFPATGQPLPLISKGGTSILIISAFFGLLLRMSCEMEEDKNKEQRAKNKDIEQNSENKNIAKNEISEEKSEEILEIENEIIEEISDTIIEIPEDKIAETTEILIN